VTSEVLEQNETGMIFIHLLNYDDQRTPQVGNIQVALRIPKGKQVKAINVLSPDEDGSPQELQHTSDGAAVRFDVPHLATYSVVRVSLQ